LIFNYKVTKI